MPLKVNLKRTHEKNTILFQCRHTEKHEDDYVSSKPSHRLSCPVSVTMTQDMAKEIKRLIEIGQKYEQYHNRDKTFIVTQLDENSIEFLGTDFDYYATYDKQEKEWTLDYFDANDDDRDNAYIDDSQQFKSTDDMLEFIFSNKAE
jgi:D-alanyl-D-alanine dipeptidase